MQRSQAPISIAAAAEHWDTQQSQNLKAVGAILILERFLLDQIFLIQRDSGVTLRLGNTRCTLQGGKYK